MGSKNYTSIPIVCSDLVHVAIHLKHGISFTRLKHLHLFKKKEK